MDAEEKVRRAELRALARGMQLGFDRGALRGIADRLDISVEGDPTVTTYSPPDNLPKIQLALAVLCGVKVKDLTGYRPVVRLETKTSLAITGFSAATRSVKTLDVEVDISGKELAAHPSGSWGTFRWLIDGVPKWSMGECSGVVAAVAGPDWINGPLQLAYTCTVPVEMDETSSALELHYGDRLHELERLASREHEPGRVKATWLAYADFLTEYMDRREPLVRKIFDPGWEERINSLDPPETSC